ncbi:MAG: hypothetical protein NC421_04085 [Lachnospiraceae bacterium]|nr:hypothetical protein [Lachnospiraceae bacterium]
MSIRAYAPGRTDEIITIPEGIVTLEYGCLNYNKYVRRIILPSSIRNIEGLDGLPELKEIVIVGNTGKYISKDGLIFTNDGSKLPYFVSLANKRRIIESASDSLFNELLWSTREEALKERWHGIKYSNILFYRYSSGYSLKIIYNGRFYQQIWRISMDRGTRITIGYAFVELWKEVPYNECFDNNMMWEKDIDDNGCTPTPLSGCSPCCRHRANCEAIYQSNNSYIRNLQNLKELGDFRINHYGGIEFNMPTTTPIEYIKSILWKFLDIALELRTKYKILEQPPHTSLFHNPDPYIYDEDYLEYFPFNFNCSIGSSQKRFISEMDNLIYYDPDFYYDETDIDTEDREPPF